MKRSEKTKRKMSEAQKGEKSHCYGKPAWNKGKKGVQIAWNKGKKGEFKHTEGSKKKISEANQGTKNSFFGKTHSQKTKQDLRRLSSGNENRAKAFVLMAPSGEVVKGVNLTKFARENNLSQQNLHAVLVGKRKSHKGWRIPKLHTEA